MLRIERKKVVYLIGTLKIGGAERQIVETAARLNRECFEPKLYCLFGDGQLKNYAEDHNVAVTIFNARRHDSSSKKYIPFWRSRAFFSLYSYLKHERPDIVHCYMFKPSIYGGIAAKLAKCPTLITSRRCLGYLKDRKPHYQYVENAINVFTDSVLVNSEALKQDVLRRERISHDKVHVIYNGVDTGKYVPVEKGSHVLHKKRASGIPETAPVIGMIANLFEYKGYREFISAASKIHQHVPEAYFLCVGEDRGKIQGQLEQLSDNFGIRKHIIFSGLVKNVSEILPLFDIQVSASHQEGFSNVILEGMAAGKPVVATLVGGNPEAVLHKETGLLVPPRDPAALAHAIIELLGNPEFASTLGSNGRRRVEVHFSIEKTIQQLETFYRGLSSKYETEYEGKKHAQ